VTALGKAGDPRSGKHLVTALNDISPRVRAAATTSAIARRIAGRSGDRLDVGVGVVAVVGGGFGAIRVVDDGAISATMIAATTRSVPPTPLPRVTYR